ncbi:uncharacterized protein rab11fip5a isoform X1 [Scomber scombrus]|uniref:Uncharacterized protein rab11fip5a isoform X1 n=1 Tax=Scomber scombrus TaxID=13677 RepID=A0AAV1P269_SCOSC
MDTLSVDDDQRWVPTHVQVTVLKGRGLRGKGKHGTSDVYTIIQLGKEKYSTCVVEKTTEPEWREECCFELQPGVLERGGRCAYPAGSNELILIVMHRALIGLDVFLGQAVIHLDKVFHESRCLKNEWYRLNSKTGKKEKERGDIQVTVQFTRNNLTASMYDLVMKDKTGSTFRKLKDRIKGKRRASEEDSSSAVVPSGYGSVYRMRQRMPSDGGGEEDYEDDEGGEARRSKMRNFFLRGKLRKSSDTRSSTSLGSESSESSRGGSLSPTAGISVVVSDLSNSPSNSSNLTADNSPEHTANTSPRSSSLRCEFGDETGEITIAVPQPTVCVNGSHAYKVQHLDPGSGKPADSLGVGLLQKSLPLSMSLQNLSPRADTDLPKGTVGDGRRWSFDKPGEEEKAAIAAALEQSGPMVGDEEECLEQTAPPSSSSAESESQGKKQRRNLFSHGKSDSAGKRTSQSKDESEQAHAATEEKHRGWFGSKDSHSKPSLVVSPKLEPSTDPHPPPLPPSHYPPGLPVDPSSLHHSNPFCHSQTTSPPMSPCNPFFSLVQHNPFYEDMLTAQPLKPSLPPLPYLSSSRPPIALLFPQASKPNLTLTHDSTTTKDSITGSGTKSDVMVKVRKRPLPPTPVEKEKHLSKKLSNPFMSAGELEPDSEWDESFEAFAAGRLQSPEDLTTDCKTQQNTPGGCPLEHCNNKGTSPPIADAHQITNVKDSLHQRPLGITLSSSTESSFEAHKATCVATDTNTHHFDTFLQCLDTIPEYGSFEDHNKMFNTSANPPKLDACFESFEANSTTNTNVLTDTNTHQSPFHAMALKLNSSSPDPGSSGLGSLAEDDFLSCFSSSEKFSASSSDDAEAQNFSGFEISTESTMVNNLKQSESEDDVADRSKELSLVDVGEQTVIQHWDDDKKIDLNTSEGALAPQSPVLTYQQPVITAKETESESRDNWTPNFSSVMYPDLLPKLSSDSELLPKPDVSLQPDNENEEKAKDEAIVDFSEELNGSSVTANSDTDKMISSTPDDELCSTHPSLYIITSSPGVSQRLSDSPFESTSLGGQAANQHSLVPFGLLDDFLDTSHIESSPGRDIKASDQNASSLLQSLYESPDSQYYQSCQSQPSSKCSNVSESEETLNSAYWTLCGELSESQTPADDALGPKDSSNGETNHTDQFEESLCGAEDKTTTLEPSFTIGEDLSLQLPPAAPTDSYMSCNPKPQPAVLDDMFSKSPQAQSATLHRSQSEGKLVTPFDELLVPSFGSDPCALKDLSSARLRPDLPSLTSFAPFLTPDRSSSPLALCPLSSFANASAGSPPSVVRAAAPALANAKPMPQETQQQQQQQQQQAANQQNSPHPVKPLTTAMLADEKRTEGRSVLATGLEKLKSTIHPGRSSQLSEQETERKKSLTEGAGSYYHLNHNELVALLVQRESEMERQKAEFKHQKALLAKREVELRKLKPQVRDLEDYIDTLLVRIMEQKPTLLQVRSKLK